MYKIGLVESGLFLPDGDRRVKIDEHRGGAWCAVRTVYRSGPGPSSHRTFLS
ncbi:hypothetical protein Fuma_03525 [Fuerstiella marisgermanici]|uniref:Uncharacterized protein n=1 Tax=Fuerstiella marisgermanici TaxID=1891926 RepID=A0A1P8WIN5_9PLAN|nr:hypothetical protein Fuma_03525 [Fuerstiella marisgermanici]